ncbi:MAG: response regulator [Deltaproteobacteria bacterium]|nr:response regulator [Deltaproteobacteria bacterium]
MAFTVISFLAVATIIKCHHACSILLDSTIKTHNLTERARADFYRAAHIADSVILNSLIGDHGEAESLFKEFNVSTEALGRDFDEIIALIEKDPFVDKSIAKELLDKMSAAKKQMISQYFPEIAQIYFEIKVDRDADVSSAAKVARTRLSEIAETVLTVASGIETAGAEAYANYVDYLLAQIRQLRNFIIASIIASFILLLPLLILIKKPIKDAQLILQKVKEGQFIDLRSPYKNEIAILLNDVAEIIDRYKEALDEKETMRLEAVKANESKSRFLATMSHEIRTPMNAVIGITEMELIRENVPKSLADSLGKIRASGHVLLGIINDLLDLSKIETGKLELIPGEYDLPSLINDTAQLNIIRIGSKPLEFALEVDPSVPASLIGDSLRIKQILNNILSNAFKYTERGQVTMAVAFTPNESGDNGLLTFRVTDTGQGMSQEDVARLFEEYSRFNQGLNRDTEGTGLGMAITQKLTSMMKGSIAVKSQPGRGSEFTVSLPQLTVRDSNVIGQELAERLSKFTYLDNNFDKNLLFKRNYMPYGSVLVVDDLESNLFVAQGLMAPYGLKIEAVTNGRSALDRVRAGEVYDVIFLDHMMPEMDGLETIGRIRELGYTAPIIALTANAISGNDKMFREHGFDGFISKPIDLRLLDATLNAYVAHRRPHEAKLPESPGTTELASEALAPDSTPLPEIEGLDVAVGLARIGGSRSRYLDLLEVFLRDANGDLAILATVPDDPSLTFFTTRVHALKSALANIGAEALSESSALLEKAGRESDFLTLKGKLPPFHAELTALLGRISENVAQFRAGGSEPPFEPGVADSLTRLLEALKEKDTEAIDDNLAQLRAWPLAPKDSQVVSEIADSILVADFQRAMDSLLAWRSSFNGKNAQ